MTSWKGSGTPKILVKVIFKNLKNIKKRKEQWLFIICQIINVGQCTFFFLVEDRNPSKWTKWN